MDIALIAGGVTAIGFGAYFLIASDKILSSEWARMGVGLRAWLTGQGMRSELGGSIATTAGPVMDEVGKDGRPRMRETTNIASI